MSLPSNPDGPSNLFHLLLRASLGESLLCLDSKLDSSSTFLRDPTHDASLSYAEAILLMGKIANLLQTSRRSVVLAGGETPTLAIVSPYNQPSQILALFSAWLAGWKVAMVPITISTPQEVLETMLLSVAPSLILTSDASQTSQRVRSCFPPGASQRRRPEILTFHEFLSPLLSGSSRDHRTVCSDPLVSDFERTTKVQADLTLLSGDGGSLDLSRLGEVDSPALILFTSSAISRRTTKAAVLSHRFLHLQGEGSLELVRIQQRAHVLGCSSLNHAMGIYIELIAFVLGTSGTYVFPCPPHLLKERRGLLGEECAHVLSLPRSNITALAATPGTVKSWIRRTELVPHLRRLQVLPCAGADVDDELFEWARRESVPVMPCYGMTEIGVAAYGQPANHNEVGSNLRVMQLTSVLRTDGPPKADEDLLSSFGSQSKDLVVGQLVIDASSTIFDGYWMVDGEGRRYFLPHSGAYETGDLMEFVVDEESSTDCRQRCPSFSFVSRIDDTIQLESGDKVLAGRFEQALDECEGIVRSFVCGDQEAHSKPSQALLAYVEMDKDVVDDEEGRNLCLASALSKVNATVSAPAKISPDRVRIVPTLPVTSKNATFRKKIKEELFFAERCHVPGVSEDGPARCGRRMESGRTVVEEVVDEARKLVQAQLGIESSGLVADHLSLQGLGLSSSQAVRFFGTVKARHRVELDASLLFTSETFGELCRAIRASIESCKHEEEESTSSSSTPVEIEKTLPPSDSTEERIAVVGAGVRLPGGVKNVEDFWNSLVTAKGPTGEAILSPITKERRRYLGRDGDRMPSYPCGWLSGSEGVEDFDAGFFGISDEEAIHTKPQQRLLLELTYETLQDAMIPPGQLKGARVGVFIGCSNADGYDEVMRASGVDQFNKLAGGSLNQSVLCGRLSHHFDWQGPSMTIQAACSSGLNVIELAVTSLQRRECDYALVGGVTTHLGALTLSFLASAGMSSPTGTSKPFGKDSNGYVPSEGCATLLLRRLADAESSWDRIYGCIEAASSAHQGRTATMATTNSASQRRIHSSVLAKAGLRPSEISMVEAHGTSTALGDSIEASAIIETFKGRPAHLPLVVSSSKSVFGHTEEAAGIVGVLKALLCLRRGWAPPHHAGEIRQAIRWKQVPALMQSELRNPLPALEHSKALVSGIGYAGTLGALVVGKAPERVAPPPASNRLASPSSHQFHLLQFSAPSERLLREQMESVLRVLRDSRADLGSVEVALAFGQDQFEHRLGLVASSSSEAVTQIQSALALDTICVASPRSGRRRGDDVFAIQFSGQGGLALDQARELYQSSVVFRQEYDRCASLIADKTGADVRDAMRSEGPVENRPWYTQPCLFALQYALYHWFRSHVSNEPAVAFGHSIGQVAAAAVAAKLLSLTDAVDLICLRGSLCDKAPKGAMVAVKATEEEAKSVLRLLSEKESIDLAARNGTDSLTYSGSVSAISRFENLASSRGFRSKRLDVTVAYHSRCLIGPLEALKRWKPKEERGRPDPRSSARFLSTDGSGSRDGQDMGGERWFKHALSTVHYSDVLKEMHSNHRPSVLVEIGPAPQLTALAKQQLPDTTCLALLARRGGMERDVRTQALQALFQAGLKLSRPDLTKLRRRTDAAGRLGLHLFERKRCWPCTPAEEIQPSLVPPTLESLRKDGQASFDKGEWETDALDPTSLAWSQVSCNEDGTLLQALVPGERLASLSGKKEALESALLSACRFVDPSYTLLDRIEVTRSNWMGEGCSNGYQCVAFCPAEHHPDKPARLRLVATDFNLGQQQIASVHGRPSRRSEKPKWKVPDFTRARLVMGGGLPRAVRYLMQCSSHEWQGLLQVSNDDVVDSMGDRDLFDLVKAADPTFPLHSRKSDLLSTSGFGRLDLRRPHWLHLRREVEAEGNPRMSLGISPWDRAGECVLTLELEGSREKGLGSGRSISKGMPAKTVEEVEDSKIASSATEEGQREAMVGNPLYLPPQRSELHSGILCALDEIAYEHCRSSLRGFDEKSVSEAQRSYFEWAKRVAGQGLRYDGATARVTDEERIRFGSMFEAVHRVGKRQQSIYRDSRAAVQALFCPDILTDVYRSTATAENIGNSIPNVLRRIATSAIESGRSTCRILEIGAGTGQLTRLVAAASKPLAKELRIRFELVLTDVSLTMARKARQAAVDAGFDSGSITLSTVDIITGELGAGFETRGEPTFDGVMMADVLHIATDLEKILSILSKLLRPGGSLYAWELDAQLLERQGPGAIFIEHLFGAFPDWWPKTRDHAVLTEKEWISTLERHFVQVHTHHPALEGAGSILLFAQTPRRSADSFERRDDGFGIGHRASVAALDYVTPSPSDSGDRSSKEGSRTRTTTTTTATSWGDAASSSGSDKSPGSPSCNAQLEAGCLMGVIQETCREALSLEEIPEPDQDLFALGMDSLSSALVLSRLSDAMGGGVDLPLDLFYSSPTPRAAAEQLASVNVGGTPSAKVTEDPLEVVTASEGKDPRPRTAATIVKEACQRALGLEEEGRGPLEDSSDLFDFGLDSLSSAQAISMIEKECQVELPIDLFYTATTVGGAAEEVTRLMGDRIVCTSSKRASLTDQTDATLVRTPADTEQLKLEEECAKVLDELEREVTTELHFVPRRSSSGFGATTILVTGATGTVGSNLVASLLSRGYRVICPCRRGGFETVSKRLEVISEEILAPASAETIRRGLAEGRLEAIETRDVCSPKLGMKDSDYERLVEGVDCIVHSAWRIAYSPTVSGFSRHFQGLVHLLRLAADSSRVVGFHFVSSIAAARIVGWEASVLESGRIPERLVGRKRRREAGMRLTDNESYGASKMIAEALLGETVGERVRHAPRVAIHRLSQVCGDSRTGWWKPHSEVAPCVLSSANVLEGALLAPQGEGDWIPSNVCGEAMAELIQADLIETSESGGGERVKVYHLSNPCQLSVGEWSDLWVRVTSQGRLKRARMLAPGEYRKEVEEAVARRGKESVPAHRTLSYLGTLEKVDERRRGMVVNLPRESLRTLETERRSRAMRECPRLNERLMTRYWQAFRRQWKLCE